MEKEFIIIKLTIDGQDYALRHKMMENGTNVINEEKFRGAFNNLISGALLTLSQNGYKIE